MSEENEILSSKFDEIHFTAVTEFLSIKVSRSSTTGKLTYEQIHNAFQNKLKRAYEFEKLARTHLPKICAEYTAVKNTDKDALFDEDRWQHSGILMTWQRIFNLIFKVFLQFKNAKTKPERKRKHALLVALLSLDDVELWEKHQKRPIYNVKDLIVWYNEHIDPFAAILIDPELKVEVA